jgi:hypothetical protein
MSRTLAFIAPVGLLAAGCFSSGSNSVASPTARAPTHGEREAIVRAISAEIRDTPAPCLGLVIKVSQSGAYAFLGREVLNSLPGGRCLRYQSNGFQILRKTGSRWTIVHTGSDPPRCSLGIPPEVIPAGFSKAGDPKLRCLKL